MRTVHLILPRRIPSRRRFANTIELSQISHVFAAAAPAPRNTRKHENHETIPFGPALRFRVQSFGRGYRISDRTRRVKATAVRKQCSHVDCRCAAPPSVEFPRFGESHWQLRLIGG